VPAGIKRDYAGSHPTVNVFRYGDAQEVREMTRWAALDVRVTHAVPVIDPRSLTRTQLAGSRCAVPNCGRLLAPPAYEVGRLPDGRPVLACAECAPGVRYERAEERIVKAA
jgi:hypothetical protein